MIEIEIKAERDPRVLAELIAQAHGEEAPDPRTALGRAASLVRAQQDEEVKHRPSRNMIETVDFQKLEPDEDWSDV